MSFVRTDDQYTILARPIYQREDFRLVQRMGSDASIIAAARVSTQGELSLESLEKELGEGAKLIRFLMKNRHGTPFEHNSLTFWVRAPIFVFREFHRHRIGFSYNEESGRYKELDGVFWIPAQHRPLVQEGKPGHYTYVQGTQEQWEQWCEWAVAAYQFCYETYKRGLDAGIAREVARTVLPVGLYSSMYVTCNARSLMAFLSLRTKEEGSTFPSYPMAEIEQVARMMEGAFSLLFPLTYRAFNEFGRVSP